MIYNSVSKSFSLFLLMTFTYVFHCNAAQPSSSWQTETNIAKLQQMGRNDKINRAAILKRIQDLQSGVGSAAAVQARQEAATARQDAQQRITEAQQQASSAVTQSQAIIEQVKQSITAAGFAGHETLLQEINQLQTNLDLTRMRTAQAQNRDMAEVKDEYEQFLASLPGYLSRDAFISKRIEEEQEVELYIRQVQQVLVDQNANATNRTADDILNELNDRRNKKNVRGGTNAFFEIVKGDLPKLYQKNDYTHDGVTGLTFLHYAINEKFSSDTLMFIAACDVTVLDKQDSLGQTPLHLIFQRHNILDELISESKGPSIFLKLFITDNNIKFKDSTGRTPLRCVIARALEVSRKSPKEYKAKTKGDVEVEFSWDNVIGVLARQQKDFEEEWDFVKDLDLNVLGVGRIKIPILRELLKVSPKGKKASREQEIEAAQKEIFDRQKAKEAQELAQRQAELAALSGTGQIAQGQTALAGITLVAPGGSSAPRKRPIPSTTTSASTTTSSTATPPPPPPGMPSLGAGGPPPPPPPSIMPSSSSSTSSSSSSNTGSGAAQMLGQMQKRGWRNHLKILQDALAELNSTGALSGDTQARLGSVVSNEDLSTKQGIENAIADLNTKLATS